MPLQLLPAETKTPAEMSLLDSVTNRPPVTWAGHPFAGIPGYGRVCAGIPGRIRVRDLCGMRGKPAVEQPIKMPICRYFSGSDGTRTRDLRRDRPRHSIRQVSASHGE